MREQRTRGERSLHEANVAARAMLNKALRARNVPDVPDVLWEDFCSARDPSDTDEIDIEVYADNVERVLRAYGTPESRVDWSPPAAGGPGRRFSIPDTLDRKLRRE